MRISIFSTIILFLLVSLVSFAQPAEFFLIEENVKSPDKLIASEFSKDIDGDILYSVEMVSNKSIRELEQIFKSKIGLCLTGVSFSKNDSMWKLRMKKVSESFLKMPEFEKLLSADWDALDNQISYSINSLALTLKIRFNRPEQLQHNIQLVEKFGLKFSGTEPHPNSSVAIFTRNFNEKIDKTPVKEEPELFKGFLAELTESGRIVENNSTSGSMDILLQVKSDKFSIFFKSLRINAQLLHSIALDASLESIPSFTVVGHNTNNSASEDKIENLHSLIKSESINWIFNSTDYTSGLVLSGFKTDFKRKIQLFGYTPKSSDIFTKLFPVLKKCGFIGNPFFSRGTYLEKHGNRIMKFTIDLDWIE